MRSHILAPLMATSLIVAAPVSAQEMAPETEWAERVADPEFQEQMAGMLGGFLTVILDIPIGQFATAAQQAIPEGLEDKVDRDGKLSRIDPDMTIGDLASGDNPDFEQDMQGKLRKGSAMAGILASEIGALLPQLKAMSERMKRRMEEQQ
ncbi:hypothetical protein SAMN02745824_0453 [Parasphingorhabdus marina DSM 22363]|uniref:Uncharacterized protein n=1 Tax=Parasphingorhabdus marina DSM 22363 TaxID=1123272 RepID=A0A1N6CNA3_9SPHN|nr:hypothetical protein [Parasphingorhabdus marina]SIN59915.1 hypothetical protein SAMN02745824_0453 [Parasphingorhabdus marina DSM 22363]